MKIKAVYNSKANNKKIIIGNNVFVNGNPIVVDVTEEEAAYLRERSKQDYFDILEEYTDSKPVKTSVPAVEEPVAEEPVAEEPVAEEPVAEEPVVEETVVEETVVDETVAEEPVADETVAEEPKETSKKKSRKSTKKGAEDAE